MSPTPNAPPNAGEIQLQPFTLGLLHLLQRKCPAIFGAQYTAANSEVAQTIAALFILTRPIEETLSAYEKGPLCFEAEAARVASRIPMAEIVGLLAKMYPYAEAQLQAITRLASQVRAVVAAATPPAAPNN